MIVGGGSAGWITAGLLAARHRSGAESAIEVTVIESPDIPIVGVGEGTWPSMRTTLQRMGVSERDFMRACSASYKQGSKFCNWHKSGTADFYYHPFDAPGGGNDTGLADHWLATESELSFSNAVCPQERLCEQHLSPKLMTSRDYAGVTNYGYHLDAGAFSVFLREHCTDKLGVTLVADTMTSINASETGDIVSVETRGSGAVEGDIFIDCTGFRSLLLGQHFGVDLVSKKNVLFPDTALAVQVPYGESDPIQSTTVATAQPAGWIWDVSLHSRRGVGHVFSSSYMDVEQATVCVQKYLGLDEKDFGKLAVRKIGIGSGHRAVFWKQNCIAIGLSAGFLEPLEASALMLIESCANMVAEELPLRRQDLDEVSERFNTRLLGLWDHIIHFLKLHYCLSNREEAFWRDNRSPESLPVELKADLEAWAQAGPASLGLAEEEQAFPAVSYQYVLYGMGFRPASSPVLKAGACTDKLGAAAREADRLASRLASNRVFLDQLNT